MKNKKNIYLLAGGGPRKPDALIPVFRQILNETDKKNPDIAYIGTANGDDTSFFNFMKQNIQNAGNCTMTHVFLSQKNADLRMAKSTLRKADIIFVSGGDVYEGMSWLNFHNLCPFLKDLYKKGTVFFGVSAGSIMLGTYWVNWEDPDNDSTVRLFECMGIASIVCDTHSEREGWEELKIAVSLLKKNNTGYGIPSGGVIITAPDGKLTAIGKPSVIYKKTGGRAVKAGVVAIKK